MRYLERVRSKQRQERVKEEEGNLKGWQWLAVQCSADRGDNSRGS